MGILFGVAISIAMSSFADNILRAITIGIFIFIFASLLFGTIFVHIRDYINYRTEKQIIMSILSDKIDKDISACCNGLCELTRVYERCKIESSTTLAKRTLTIILMDTSKIEYTISNPEIHGGILFLEVCIKPKVFLKNCEH